MATYVVEMYVSRARAGERSKLDRRARAAAESVSAEGVPVLYVRSVFVPEDEICLHFFDAPTREAVIGATRRAGLSYERILEATERSTTAGEDRPDRARGSGSSSGPSSVADRRDPGPASDSIADGSETGGSR